MVALIVKADDLGLAMAGLTSTSAISGLVRVIGRMLVLGMPYFLKALGIIGTAAMIWVGGGIVVHGFETYGLGGLSHLIHDMADMVAHRLPAVGGVVRWLVEAAGAGLAGIAVGLVTIPAISYCIAPIWRRLKPKAQGT